jgi:hypothetical protein
VSLVVLAAWCFVANARSDSEYKAFHGQGLSQFNINFQLLLRLEILNHPDDTAWFVAHGMPDPADLTGYKLASPVLYGSDTGQGEALDAYMHRPDLVAWGNRDARNVYAKFVATHPAEVAARFSRELPYLVVPPRDNLVYARDPRNVMPNAVGNLLFDSTTGPSLPRALLGDVGLLIAAGLVLAVTARHRARDNGLLLVAGATFLLSIVAIALGWVLSPVEIVRHALPATLVLRLALWLVVFALVDALVADRPARDRAA